MIKHRAPASGVAVGLSAAVCLLCALAPTAARAQRGVPPGPLAPSNRDPIAVEETRDRQRRETQLRSLEKLKATKKGDGKGTEDQRIAEVAAQQVRDDFKDIQIFRNNIVHHLLSGKPLDYKFIAGESANIGVRAGRLKNFLIRVASAGEKKEPVEIGEGQMKDALVTMCKRIDSFTENPIFKVSTVVDVEQSAKADRDLRYILLLSAGIKKTSERLVAARKR